MTEDLEPDLFYKGGGGWPSPKTSPDLGDCLSARIGSPGESHYSCKARSPTPSSKCWPAQVELDFLPIQLASANGVATTATTFDFGSPHI